MIIHVAHPDNSYSGMNQASDSNDGSFLNPYATWQKAIEVALPGDEILIRDGVYTLSSRYHGSAGVLIDPDGTYYTNGIGNHGTEQSPITLSGYNNERPILDGTGITTSNGYLRGLQIESVKHWRFKNFEVTNFIQSQTDDDVNGIKTERCQDLQFENVSIHDIGGLGLWIEIIAGHENYPEIPTDTWHLINCDFYNCADPLASNPWNMGDGVKGDVEPGGILYITGCRAWNNSDDGFDISGAGQKIITDTWAFEMGVNYQAISEVDDGNGFKLGGARDQVNHSNWIMRNCISAGNYAFALHELDYDAEVTDTYYRNNAKCYNSTFYNNKYGPWSFDNIYHSFNDTEFYNCITYGHTSIFEVRYTYEHPVINCNWNWAPGGPPFEWNTDLVTITDADFQSLNIEELKAPRKTDGSLPDVNFLRLTETSDARSIGHDGSDLGALPYSIEIAPPSGDITNATELQAAINTANFGDVIEISSNSITGDVTINTDTITITSANGFNAVFTGTITIDASNVELTNVTLSNEVIINQAPLLNINNCTINSNGSLFNIQLQQSDWMLDHFSLEENNINFIGTTITYDGSVYSVSRFRAIYINLFNVVYPL